MATEYYVSDAGDDSFPGSLVLPWKTLGPANSHNFVAGDSLNLRGGDTFVGPLILDSADLGTDTAPVWITSYGTGRATIRTEAGRGLQAINVGGFEVSNLNFHGANATTNGNDGLLILNTGSTHLSHVYLTDLDITQFGQAGVRVLSESVHLVGYDDVRILRVDSHHNLQDGIDVYATDNALQYKPNTHTNVYVGYCAVAYNTGTTSYTGFGIAVSETDGGLIENCTVSFCGSALASNHAGIYVASSTGVTVSECEVHDTTGTTGVSYTGADGIVIGWASQSCTVEYCYTHDNDGAGLMMYSGATTDLWQNNTLRFNISEDDARERGAGIHLTGNPAINGLQLAQIYHNTVYVSPTNPGLTAITVLANIINHSVYVRNNILMTSGSVPIMDVGTSNGGITFQGNCYWNTTGALFLLWQGALYTTLASWRTATNQETNGIGIDTGLHADPLLTSPGAGGSVDNALILNASTTITAYRVGSTSPVLDAGVRLDLLGVSPGLRDFYGSTYPSNATPDIGAHEFHVVGVGESGNSNEVTETTGLIQSANSNEISIQARASIPSGNSNEVGIHAHGLRTSGASLEYGPIRANATLLSVPPLAAAPSVVCGPVAPTVLSTITDGMIEAGQYQVTPTQVTTFWQAQFQTLKSEMWLACQTDELLETEVVLVAQPGISMIQLPCDFDTEVSVHLYTGERGVALDGTGQTTTLGLAAGSRLEETQLLGQPVFLTSWNGAPQMRQIVGYSAARHTVTVDGPWDWPPTRGTTYVLGTSQSQLSRTDHRRIAQSSGTPQQYTRSGSTLTVLPSANQLYPLLMLYRANLTRVNEDSPMFLKHLRERRALWMQGIKAKTMARFDDERATQEEAKWQAMLAKYAATNAVYEQMEGWR
jgi:Right handed beta helix region